MTTRPTRITLADIAAETGLSKTAVSYALRDHPHSAKATRKLVKEAAARLGYRPDPKLSELMQHLHGDPHLSAGTTVAILNTGPSEDFHHITRALRDFVNGARKQAEQLGYRTENFWLGHPDFSPSRLANILEARGIQGILVGSTGHPYSELDFPWEKFSAVTVGYSVSRPRLHRVATHHYENTHLAVRMVRDLGYTKIGLLVDPIMEPAMKNLHLAALYTAQQEWPEQQRIPPCVGDQPFPNWVRRYQPEALLNASRYHRPYLLPQGLPESTPVISMLAGEEETTGAGIHLGYEKLGYIAMNKLADQILHNEPGIPEDPRITLIQGTWYNDGTILPFQRKN